MVSESSGRLQRLLNCREYSVFKDRVYVESNFFELDPHTHGPRRQILLGLSGFYFFAASEDFCDFSSSFFGLIPNRGADIQDLELCHLAPIHELDFETTALEPYLLKVRPRMRSVFFVRYFFAEAAKRELSWRSWCLFVQDIYLKRSTASGLRSFLARNLGNPEADRKNVSVGPSLCSTHRKSTRSRAEKPTASQPEEEDSNSDFSFLPMVVPECIVSRDNQLGEVEFYHEFSRNIADQFTTSTISIDVTAPFLPDKPCMPNPFDNGLLVACTKCRLTDSRFYPDVNLVSMLTCPAAVGDAAQLDEDDYSDESKMNVPHGKSLPNSVCRQKSIDNEAPVVPRRHLTSRVAGKPTNADDKTSNLPNKATRKSRSEFVMSEKEVKLFSAFQRIRRYNNNAS